MFEWTQQPMPAELFSKKPENWRRPPWCPLSAWIHNISDDLSSFNMELTDARDAA